jgi:hypothetical protein
MAVRFKMPVRTGRSRDKTARSLEDHGCLGMAPTASAEHEKERGRKINKAPRKIGTSRSSFLFPVV